MEEGSCAVRSRWIVIKPSMLGIWFCYRPHCLLPWQQTEISLHTHHPSAFQHSYHPLLSSPPSQPPRSYYPLLCSQHPREFGEYTSIDLLQTSGVRSVTWLIQMSVRSLPHFFSFQAVSIWEPVTLAESRTVQQNELSCFSRLCQSSKVLSGDPAVRPLRAIMHHRLGKLCRETLCLAFSGGMSEVEMDTLSHLFGLPHHMSSRKTLFFWSPNRNRLTSTLPWRQPKNDWQEGYT